MSAQIQVPTFPESITEGEIASWHKAEGDVIHEGDVIVEVETDKVVMEVPAAQSGVMGKQLKAEGDVVTSEEVIGDYKPGAVAEEAPAEEAPAAPAEEKAAPAAPAPAAAPAGDVNAGPGARRMMRANDIDAAAVSGSGKGGRVTSSDVTSHMQIGVGPSGRSEERVPMTRLRQTVAKRLLEVQSSNAILTTFNEVDMHAVKTIRARYKDQFEKSHGVKLGFMSFFLKAATEALKRFPAVNASIDGKDIVYHGFYDIGVAVSAPRGLVVPVVRNVDQLSLAQIEEQILAYAKKAREGSLSIEEMQGGTFTVTNGGVFGSMLSTPIINPPQSAILGMHNIVDHAVVVDGEIKVRPVMYLALSYDHRIIDGRESVSFLKAIKDCLEDPARLLLNL